MKFSGCWLNFFLRNRYSFRLASKIRLLECFNLPLSPLILFLWHFIYDTYFLCTKPHVCYMEINFRHLKYFIYSFNQCRGSNQKNYVAHFLNVALQKKKFAYGEIIYKRTYYLSRQPNLMNVQRKVQIMQIHFVILFWLVSQCTFQSYWLHCHNSAHTTSFISISFNSTNSITNDEWKLINVAYIRSRIHINWKVFWFLSFVNYQF